MPKKIKLKLGDLKVQSFQTTEEIAGGAAISFVVCIVSNAICNTIIVGGSDCGENSDCCSGYYYCEEF